MATVLRNLNGCSVEQIRAPPRQNVLPPFTLSIAVESGEIMKNIHRSSTQREMFVLPSQMNGAEYPNPDTIVKDVLDYVGDETGGPRGQLACDLTVAQFICDNASNSKNPGGINYVRKLTEFTPSIHLKNGYLTEGKPGGNSRATKIDCQRFVRQRERMEILLSRNIAVTGMVPSYPLYRNTPRKKTMLTKAKRVDLVYASAVPFNNYDNGDSKEWESVCKATLTQQYYLALAAAAHCITQGKYQSYKVNCMPLGGGVFNNQRTWIYTALRQAIDDARTSFLTPEVAKILSVSILCWENSPEEVREFSELQADDPANVAAGKGAKPAAKAAGKGARKIVRKVEVCNDSMKETSLHNLVKSVEIQIGTKQLPLRPYQAEALVEYLQGKYTDQYFPQLLQLSPNQMPQYVDSNNKLFNLKLQPAAKAVVREARINARLANSAKLLVDGQEVPLRSHQICALVDYLQGKSTEQFYPPLAELASNELPQYVTMDGSTLELVMDEQSTAELRSARQRLVKLKSTS